MTPPETRPRYAVYFAPEADSPWWAAGSQWLGRCARSGQDLARPSLPGLTDADLERLTRAPRHYGWHATLKAPFHLANGVSESVLRLVLSRIAQGHQAFDIPELTPQRLDDFLALRPADQSAIAAVAESCVRELLALSAPPGEAELARRRAAGLSPREEALLQRWGYPFVLDRYRFHLSLSGSLAGESPALAERLLQGAGQHFQGLPSCRFASLSLFVETAPQSPMRWLDSFALRR